MFSFILRLGLLRLAAVCKVFFERYSFLCHCCLTRSLGARPSTASRAVCLSKRGIYTSAVSPSVGGIILAFSSLLAAYLVPAYHHAPRPPPLLLRRCVWRWRTDAGFGHVRGKPWRNRNLLYLDVFGLPGAFGGRGPARVGVVFQDAVPFWFFGRGWFETCWCLARMTTYATGSWDGPGDHVLLGFIARIAWVVLWCRILLPVSFRIVDLYRVLDIRVVATGRLALELR